MNPDALPASAGGHPGLRQAGLWQPDGVLSPPIFCACIMPVWAVAR